MIKHTAHVFSTSSDERDEAKHMMEVVKVALANKETVTINDITFVPKQARIETSLHNSHLVVEGYIR